MSHPTEHVLARKLVAQHTGMVEATAEDYADLLQRVYPDEGTLAQMLGVPGAGEEAIRSEALLLGQWAHDFA